MNRKISLFVILAIFASFTSNFYHPKVAQAFASGDPATNLLGQLDSAGAPIYTTARSGNVPNANTTTSPTDVAIDETNDRLFVAGNNRVLVYNLNTSHELLDRTADYVIGVPNLYYSGYGVTTQSGFYNPTAIVLNGDGSKLFVADTENRRVMVFNLADGIGDDEGGTVENATNVIGQLSFTAAEYGTTATSFLYNGPTGLAYDTTNDYLFVSDTYNHRVLVFDATAIAAPGDPTTAIMVLGQAGFTSSTSAQDTTGLSYPRGLDYDNTNSRLFIADSGNHRVLVHAITPLAPLATNRAADFVLGQGNFSDYSSATTQTGLYSPYDVSYNSSTNKLFITDYNNHRVIVHVLTTEYPLATGRAADYVLGQENFISNSYSYSVTTADVLKYPQSAISEGNLLYVADNSNNRVLIFDTTSIVNGEDGTNLLGELDGDGNPIFTISSQALNPIGFSSPGGCFVDTTNHRVLVSHAWDNYARIMSFNLSTGNALGTAPASYVADNVLGENDFYTSSYAPYNPVAQSMKTVGAIEYDSTNKRLFVADSAYSRILVFDLSSGIVDGMASTKVFGKDNFTSWWSSDADAGTLSSPYGLAYSDGYLYASDTGKNRILVYYVGSSMADITPDAGLHAIAELGQPTDTDEDADLFDESGSGYTQNKLYSPYGLAIEDDGTTKRLYVADNSNNRVMVFDITASPGLDHGVTNGENAIYVLGQTDYGYNSSGNTAATMNSPKDVDYDTASNRLIVTEHYNNRVTIFDLSTGISNGMSATYVFGQSDFGEGHTSNGTTSTTLNYPTASCYNSSTGEIYVADYANHRMMVFNASLITNTAPVISAVSGAQQTDDGYVNINYTLTDADDETDISLTAEYSFNNVDWESSQMATLSPTHPPHSGGISDLIGSPTGTSNTFVWNACSQISTYKGTVWARFTPNDGEAAGDPAISASSFPVDCGIPTVSSVTTAQTSGTTNVGATYTLADDNSDGLTVEIDVSNDGGSSWTVTDTSVTGHVGSSQTTGSKALVWAAGTDYDGHYENDIQMRIRAKDKYQNQGTYVSPTPTATFTLDTKDPADASAPSAKWGPPSSTATLVWASDTSTSVTLTWTAATDDTFDHYELWYGTFQNHVENRNETATEWDTDDDSALATSTTTTTTITGLTEGSTYYVKIWAIDDYGNLSYLAAVTNTTNYAPIVSSISGAQQTDDGYVNISYTLRDNDSTSLSLISGGYEYSVDGTTWHPMTAATDTLHEGISTLSASPTGIPHVFVWNALTDIGNYDYDNVYFKFQPNDGNENGAAIDTLTTGVPVDCEDPAGLAGPTRTSGTSTTSTLGWTAATDANFDHYEIWYGPTKADVLSRSLTATEWDTVDDSTLGTMTTATTTIPSLTANTQYYYKIWAIDDYGHESTDTDINFYTIPEIPSLTIGLNGAFPRTQIDTSWNATGAEYYIENTTAGTNSGWINTVGWSYGALNCATTYSFKVKARTLDSYETSFSASSEVQTNACDTGGAFISSHSSSRDDNNDTSAADAAAAQAIADAAAAQAIADAAAQAAADAAAAEKAAAEKTVASDEDIAKALEKAQAAIGSVEKATLNIIASPLADSPEAQVSAAENAEIITTAFAKLQQLPAASEAERQEITKEVEKAINSSLKNILQASTEDVFFQIGDNKIQITKDTEIRVELDLEKAKKLQAENKNIIVLTPSTTVNGVSVLWAGEMGLMDQAVNGITFGAPTTTNYSILPKAFAASENKISLMDALDYGIDPTKDYSDKSFTEFLKDLEKGKITNIKGDKISPMTAFKVTGKPGTTVILKAIKSSEFDEYLKKENKLSYLIWTRFEKSTVNNDFFASVLSEGVEETDVTGKGEAITIGSTVIDENYKGIIVPETALPAGEYYLLLENVDETIASIYKVTVDESYQELTPEIQFENEDILTSSTGIYSFVLESINTRLKVPMINSAGESKMILRGRAAPGSVVYITWQSVTFSSIVVADFSQGSFELAIPENLGTGDHAVIAYVYDPATSITSNISRLLFSH